MRALTLALAMMLAASTARADDVLPGVDVGKGKASGYLAVVLGHLWDETRGDNQGRAPTKYTAWCYGLTMRGEYVDLTTVYGGRFGATGELDLWLFSPGAVSDRGPAVTADGVDTPPLSYLYVGFTPAIALGALRTKNLDVALELGAPLNTDFYGLSAGVLFRYHALSISYKVRSGASWYGTQVLDTKVRIGLGSDKTFAGLDVTHGYSEDAMSHANLGSIMKGGYTMISLVISGGR